jgi:two-component system LytT family response regulator
MATIRAMLVDDEYHCLQTLRYELARHCPEVDVIAEASSGEEALEKINAHHPDLLFLDIEMPGMSGFELLRRLAPARCNVIFVTAYDHYAIEAFRYSALDYLLKPVAGDQLREALSRARERMLLHPDTSQLDVLLHNLRDGLRSPRIVLPTAKGMDIVNAADILYCIAEGNYTRVCMADGKRYTYSKTLKEVDQLLAPLGFFRIHQSYLVQVSHIQHYLRDDGGYVVMSDGARFPIAKRRKEEFMALLKSE